MEVVWGTGAVGAACLTSAPGHGDRLPLGVCSFPDRWSLAAVERRMGEGSLQEGSQEQISQGRHRFLQLFELFRYLFQHHLSTPPPLGTAPNSWLFQAAQEESSEVTPGIETCLFSAFVLKEANVLYCRRNRRDRKTYEEHICSQPHLPKTRVASYSLKAVVKQCCAYLKEAPRNPELPGSCYMPFGVAALPCHLRLAPSHRTELSPAGSQLEWMCGFVGSERYRLST